MPLKDPTRKRFLQTAFINIRVLKYKKQRLLSQAEREGKKLSPFLREKIERWV